MLAPAFIATQVSSALARRGNDDAALLIKLGLEKVKADAAAASASAAAFITEAVKETKALGLEFSEDEGWRKAFAQRGQALLKRRSQA